MFFKIYQTLFLKRSFRLKTFPSNHYPGLVLKSFVAQECVLQFEIFYFSSNKKVRNIFLNHCQTYFKIILYGFEMHLILIIYFKI